MATPDDTRLKQAVAGDKDALARLLADHGPKVRAKLEGRIGAHFRAALDEDDVLQVTYIEAFLQIRHFDPRGTEGFVAWLARIADHNLLDAIKELDRKKRPPRGRQVVAAAAGADRDSYVMLMAELGATTTTPSQSAARHEAKELVDRALTRLPADYRQVLLLYHFEGLAVAEVAERMERSEGAVFMLRARALDQLRRHLPGESKFFSRGG